MSTFSKRKFIAAGEAFVDKQRREWIAGVKASPLAPYALMWAVREGLVLDTEELDDISADSLCPNCDIIPRANAVDMGVEGATELKAKLAISSAVKAGIVEAMAGIEAVKASEHSPQPILAPQTPGTVSGSESDIKTPPVPSTATAKGTVEGVTSHTVRLHRATIGGMEVYAIDREHLEFMQAAQVQKVKIQAVLEDGDFGLRVLDCRLADDEKA